MRKFVLLVVLSIALIAAGCGTESSISVDADYFPLEVGNEWYYEYAVVLAEPYKVKSVVRDNQKVDGRDTSVILTSTEDGTPIMQEYYVKDNNGVIILQSENMTGAFLLTPDRYMLEYPLENGHSWSWDGQYESSVGMSPLPSTAEFNTQLVGSLEVPAGSFSDVILVETIEILTVSGTTYEVRDLQWLAKDIGRIKRESYVNGELTSTAILLSHSLNNKD